MLVVAEQTQVVSHQARVSCHVPRRRISSPGLECTCNCLTSGTESDRRACSCMAVAGYIGQMPRRERILNNGVVAQDPDTCSRIFSAASLYCFPLASTIIQSHWNNCFKLFRLLSSTACLAYCQNFTKKMPIS